MNEIRLFLKHLTSEQTSKFRKWEGTNIKIINATYANIFNQNCLREHLCPKSIKLSGRTGNPWLGVQNTLLQRIKLNDEIIRKTSFDEKQQWEELKEDLNLEKREEAIRIMEGIKMNQERKVSARLSKNY